MSRVFAQPSAAEGALDEHEFFVAKQGAQPRTSYALPSPPPSIGQTRWYGPGEMVKVGGFEIRAGMIYVGTHLTAATGGTEPALINPKLRVARSGDFSRGTYWTDYEQLTPDARYAYLDWLSGGRSAPSCDSSYVMLFFAGIERRIFIDGRDDPSTKAEWPTILAELRRLIDVYGARSEYFTRHASELLSWMELDSAPARLYELPVPHFPRTFELPHYLRLALGQASIERQPVPALLALAWLRLSPDTYMRTAAMRCPEDFERLFVLRYGEAFGAGMVLPKNRTKLRMVYQPASRGLASGRMSRDFGDVPDVTAMTKPIGRLREIAQACTDELGPYSRIIGKDPDLADTLEGLLALPRALWPERATSQLAALRVEMRDGRASRTLTELVAHLGGSKQPLNRDRIRALARALEQSGIGIEPDVLSGAKTPAAQDKLVLFELTTPSPEAGHGAEFQTAALTLQLAAAMAQADNDFNAREIAHLRGEIEAWSHLAPPERARLHAHLDWLVFTPPTVAALRKKLEVLPEAARHTIARFMATLAQSDGYVSPDEVKLLERVYKLLGVDAARVFSDVHAAQPGRLSETHSIRRAEQEGFRLDRARLDALAEDTERVSALLSTIFVEEEASPPAGAEPDQSSAQGPALLGLSQANDAFLRLLLSRPAWSRAELEDVAADLDLMLDGALEQINEAAYDAFDEPLIEGEDPVDINLHILEQLPA